MKEEFEKSRAAEKEEEILAFWKEHDIFEKTVSKKSPGGDFVFYDGPPFATGLPHYGHLVAGTMKDAIPRYQTMKGKTVRRQWGWDCHGLPIENLIEKELGLKNKQDIEVYGVQKFNDAAKNSVLRYDTEWKKIVPRAGRFVDMEHSYRTMDWTYSESIWWSFKTLYDKGLAYEGYKSMHICPRCETTLANSEVTQGYKDVKDIAVVAKFALTDAPNTFLLAWTTTPWTLPGNVALAVGKDIRYARVKVEKGEHEGETYIMAAERMASILQQSGILGDAIDPLKDDSLELVAEITYLKGSDLIGRAYEPLFDYYAKQDDLLNKENGWKVYDAPFVTTGEGTGIVHIAPAFGEDDMALGIEKQLPFVQHVKMNGAFAPEVTHFAEMQVKPKDSPNSTDIEIIKYLAGKGSLFSKEKFEHSYPHCWRCDTPLLNYAASSWFVKVTALRDRLVAINKEIVWVPESVRDGRFGKWLEGARDWAVSRSRYWGAPLPVWKCDTCENVEVFGSVSEVRTRMKRSGNTYTLIRHGEAESNAGGFVSSIVTNEHHLTKKGKEQVTKTAEAFKEKKITRIFSSDFVRTRETAELIASSIGFKKEAIIFDARLREVNTGDFDGKPIEEYFNYFDSIEEKFTKCPPNGETAMDVKKRVGAFLYELEEKYAGENILIVSHEYPLWLLTAVAEGADVARSVELKRSEEEFILNAEVRELPFTPFSHNPEYEIDLHRPYIDEITIPCSCGGVLHRIPEVFDCWFESGSMPYAQFHYPFENEDLFKRNFPADFIAEGLDQTRGWFYTLLVLAVGLFGETPFKHVIANGLVLAEDGQKMAKRLKNYPDPLYIVNRYGADALRYYMLSSPVVHGEELRFSEKGVDEVFKKITLRLGNVYSFYELYALEAFESDVYKKSDNVLDVWIRARLNELILEVSRAMEAYTLDQAVKPIVLFIDDLSTWYLRRSRERFKGDDAKDRAYALSTTRFILGELSKVMAPFMPFLAEDLYQKVSRGEHKQESVHLETWPEADTYDKATLEAMRIARDVVEAALALRAKAGIKVRQPLEELAYTTKDKKKVSTAHEEVIVGEVHVKQVVFRDDIVVEDVGTEGWYSAMEAGPITIVLQTHITEALKREGQVRDLVRSIQDVRKKEGLTPSDHVEVHLHTTKEGRALVDEFSEELQKATHSKAFTYAEKVEEGMHHLVIEGNEFDISFSK